MVPESFHAEAMGTDIIRTATEDANVVTTLIRVTIDGVEYKSNAVISKKIQGVVLGLDILDRMIMTMHSHAGTMHDKDCVLEVPRMDMLKVLKV